MEAISIESRDSTPRIAIVIPALNECKAMGKVLSGIHNTMADYNYQVLVVDGHSYDGTDKIAKSMNAKVIYQSGKGYGDALKTGFFYAKKRMNAKIIVMMDADLTYDPKHIPELIKPILENQADMIVGNRFADMKQGSMTIVNRFGNQMLSLLAKLALGLKVYDTQSGMRAFRTELLDYMNLVAVGMPLAMEMLAEAVSAGARISEVPISYRPRVGETKLNPITDGGRILGVTVRLMLDVRPLLFFGSIGTILGTIGLLLHYFMLPVELMHIVFPFLFMIGGILLFWFGFVIFAFRKFKQRNEKVFHKNIC